MVREGMGVPVFRRGRLREAERRSDSEDVAILERLGGGDHDAVRDLYRLYGGPLYALGVRMLRDFALAEDMVQETFVRLWRAAPGFDPAKGTPRAFIYTIGRRAAVDLIRRQRGIEAAPLEEDAATTSPEGREPEGEGLIASMDLHAALARLSAPQREVIDLAYVEDLSQSQIAARLELPLGTVKTRTFHALRTLRQALQEEGGRV